MQNDGVVRMPNNGFNQYFVLVLSVSAKSTVFQFLATFCPFPDGNRATSVATERRRQSDVIIRIPNHGFQFFSKFFL